MKERPILMKGEMVRAILDGRKTQTRRVVKPHPYCPGGTFHYVKGRDEPWVFSPKYINDRDGSMLVRKCPYGDHGDRLWVKETWQSTVPFRTTEYVHGNHYVCDTGRCVPERAMEILAAHATDPDGVDFYYKEGHVGPTKRDDSEGAGDICWWRPSIYMPRWASRITLEVTGIRVERLQEITLLDAVDEGWHPANGQGPVEWYEDLWNAINKKRGFGWATNPWVWVIQFKKI